MIAEEGRKEVRVQGMDRLALDRVEGWDGC